MDRQDRLFPRVFRFPDPPPFVLLASIILVTECNAFSPIHWDRARAYCRSRQQLDIQTNSAEVMLMLMPASW